MDATDPQTSGSTEDLNGRVCVCIHWEGDHDAGGGACRAAETCGCCEFAAFENFAGAAVPA